MLRRDGLSRPGERGGGKGGFRFRVGAGRSWRALALLQMAAAATACSFAAAAAGDPGPVFEQGLPQTVHPTFPEPGAPSFQYPTGGTGAGAGSGGSGGGGSGGSSDPGVFNGSGGSGPGMLATGYTALLGQSVGSGQCVALAQATSDVGNTSTWVPGQQVQGATDIAPGTVIATFGADGTYTNTPSQSHAAIYLGQDASGIFVEDQWSGQVAATRHINWSTSNPYEGGSQFYVVSH